ncbi:hypothetical protein KOW79_011097 [Hemibagrus wyckioides]|uniref:Uncharacterized protein n=1 Tax=Hemibagrus wyckioides TaxID=337641 RepID=A0A9D3NLI8_9TELE|nr:hypothetical protein KOW79_011097 [Hemibagrus wyckioides]
MGSGVGLFMTAVSAVHPAGGFARVSQGFGHTALVEKKQSDPLDSRLRRARDRDAGFCGIDTPEETNQPKQATGCGGGDLHTTYRQ